MSTNQDILTANLVRLRLADPQLAQRIEQTSPAKIRWVASRAGPLAASVEHSGQPFWLCSRYNPIQEAEKFSDRVDLSKNACPVVLGMGVGYHVAQLASRLHDTQNLMIVFEPDRAVLRAVLEKVDHTGWIGQRNVLLIDNHLDHTDLLKMVEPYAGMLTQGTVLLTHPPTRSLQDQALNGFGQKITEVLGYCRTNIATTLVNASRTYRNLTMNLYQYAAGENVNELHNAATNYPAVCVGAGPSLTRNLALLTDPESRKRLVVITAQTMLKPLLARGIRPDFVTALDYHKISTRFYEGLTELPDVTLVAQPLVNHAVIDRYPGPIRVTQSSFLDQLLGDEAKPIVPMRYGATVSHLSFYLAQHLGCDPIIIIGMDLGFSNGLYYFPGTAIHDVWAPELGPFNTLEMMEWQRIVRHRLQLRKRKDIHGRSIYSDEQMVTYLKQFERDFADAPQTVIDATEGGLPKQHTECLTFAEALAKYATRPVPQLPQAKKGLDAQRLRVTAQALRKRRREIQQLRTLSRETVPLLRKILKLQHDQDQVDKLFERLESIKCRVNQLSVAFDLVNHLNAVGTFKRARTDRAIGDVGANPFEHQRQQLLRDMENVEWLIQACDELLNIIRDSLERIEQSIKTQSTNRQTASQGQHTVQPSTRMGSVI